MNSRENSQLQSVDILIKKAMVLPMTEGEPLILDGAVAIEKGKIVAVGEYSHIASSYQGKKVIDGRGKAVLPGFINTHFHFTQNFLKGSKDDVNLLDWIDKVSFPRIKEVVSQYRNKETAYHHYSVLHGGIDLLRSGITCSVNMEWAMQPQIVDSYEQVGIRAINTLTLTDVKSWTPAEAVLEHDEYFSLAESLIERCKSSKGGRVEFAYGVACLNSTTEELVVKARQRATDDKVKLHIHLAESKYEFDRIMTKYNKTPTAYLEELGFWDEDVWAAHCIWLNSADIDILNRHKVGIAHNPKCNMKICCGVAPITEMLKKGLAIGLGIDSCAVSDNTDFFEVMRTAIFLQRVTTMDPTAILGRDALVMATRAGAEVVKLKEKIGTLEVGKEADLIILDLREVNLRPFNNLINNLVFAANSSNIKTVMVAGEILIKEGKFTRFDEEAILDEAEEYIAFILRKKGLEIPPYFMIKQLEGGE